jgi:hypothetical protein
MDAKGYIDGYGVNEYEADFVESQCFGCGGYKDRKMGRLQSR